ncbi:ABC transporter substrate-binding protein [Sulfurimonas sp.]|uniref:ABC transporter substrate-binding protein n=1 Tax=Sulfurimonas sp. TaxID=2022749 RepID=UPI002615A2FC|nr:ABC transporter substrate-binding protein [Sulfurimonas sp.]
MRGIVLFVIFYSGILNAYTIVDERLHTKLEKVSLQLHWKYEFEFAGFIAAKEKGFYRDAGLDVTLKEYENDIDIIGNVVSGKATYGVYNSNTLLEYMRGKPVVLLASFFKRSALVLITKPEIKRVEDLRAKRVMASSRKDLELNFKPYFNGHQITCDDLILVQHTFRVKEFVQGKVDAMTAYISDQPYKLDELGVKYNILDPSNENTFSLQEELFTSKNEILHHEKRATAFRDASIRGWQYALEHKDEIIEIIHKKYAPHISIKDLRYEADAIDKLILPFIYDVGSVDMNFLNKQYRIFQKNHNLDSERELRNFVFKKKEESLKFTNKDFEYIDTHPSVRVCLHPKQFPIEGVSNGKMVGMIAEFYKELSKKTYLDFKPVKSSSEEELEDLLSSKKCDILAIYATRDKRYKTLKPTKPFTEVTFTLISKPDKSFVRNPSDLKNKVLITRLESYKDHLMYLYPYLNIEVEPNEEKMVKKVLSNKVYGLISVDLKADYIIDKYGYSKLKINGFLAKDNPMPVSIGLQEDETQLYSILEKGIDAIEPSDIKNIEQSWKISRYQKTVDYSLMWITLGIMSLIFLIMAYYQRKLKRFNLELEKLVDNKTKELREINDSLEATVQEKVNELIKKDEILTRQSKQAVMGEMISMIAHQWRQPLNMITLQISNIQLKDMVGQKVEKEELLKTLENINQTMVYLSNTIDDFKTYFHPNKEATAVKFNEVMQKVINFITPRLKKNNIVIKVECEEELVLNTYTNELIQVLLNIINNAIDAYQSASSQSLKDISVVCEVKDKRVKISIKDHAGGIDKTILLEVFEPYMSTKGKNGTGLGLYMSKMIVEKQFSGSISVSSHDGSTTFVIEIPVDIKKK